MSYVDVDLRGGGGSILTTTHLARFRQYVFGAAVAEQIQGVEPPKTGWGFCSRRAIARSRLETLSSRRASGGGMEENTCR